MEIQLKQRLIGAVVIFTLLIIFLPVVFENESEQKYVEQILEPPVKNIVQNDDLVKNIQNINSRVIQPDNNELEKVANESLDQTTVSNVDSVKVPSNIIKPASVTSTKKISENMERLIKRSGIKKSEFLKHLDTNNHVVNEESIMAKYNYDLKERAFKTKSSNHSVTSKSKDLARLNLKDDSRQSRIPAVTKKSSIAKRADTEEKQDVRLSSKPKLASIVPVNAKADNSYKLISGNNKITRVYAIKIAEFKVKNKAVNIKADLQNMGYPSYLRKSKDWYTVYIGPELEQQYIKELSRRITEETDYKPEIVTHDASWVVE